MDFIKSFKILLLGSRMIRLLKVWNSKSLTVKLRDEKVNALIGILLLNQCVIQF